MLQALVPVMRVAADAVLKRSDERRHRRRRAKMIRDVDVEVVAQSDKRCRRCRRLQMQRPLHTQRNCRSTLQRNVVVMSVAAVVVDALQLRRLKKAKVAAHAKKL